jgi:Fe-S-cluster-containing dehydrogenase component
MTAHFFPPPNAPDQPAAGVSGRRGFIKASGCVLLGLAVPQVREIFGSQAFVVTSQATGLVIGIPGLCVACQRCELACTEFNDGKADPGLARIKIGRNLKFGPSGIPGQDKLGLFGNGLVVQDACRQCPHPVPCATACPHGAIVDEAQSGTRIVDAQKCVGCRLCLSACPWGMMSFDEEKGIAAKCFLCNGAPKCVTACPSGALRFVPWRDLTKAPPRVPTLAPIPAEQAAACGACHR